MKIFYTSVDLIPNSDEIISLTKEESLVIELPQEELLSIDNEIQLIDRLKKDLPNNYSVFKSGVWKETVTITIKYLVSNKDIIKHLKSIRAAINEYITISNKLIKNNTSDKKTTQNWLHANKKTFEVAK